MAQSNVDSLVQNVVNSVNGAYEGAGQTMLELLQANVELTAEQVHRILAASVVEQNSDDAFITKYNIIRPATAYNQLKGNNNNRISSFIIRYATVATDILILGKALDEPGYSAARIWLVNVLALAANLIAIPARFVI
jgi:hypothetical protein